MPDIDLDFPRDIREKLIPRVHERYGARALGAGRGLRHLPVARRGRATSARRWGCRRARSSGWRATVDFYDGADAVETRPGGRARPGAGGARRAGGRWPRCAREAWGLPRHPSQHPGGMVISTRPLIDVCPVLPAAMEGRQIVQWDKDSCADAGFLKIDLLGLGMLSAVERCVEEIARRARRADRPLADPARRRPSVYGRSAPPRRPASSRSRAGRRCRCCRAPCRENLDDLTVQVALVRPGPIQGGAVHPYIERRKRLREDPAYRGPLRAPARWSRCWRTRWGRSSSRSR